MFSLVSELKKEIYVIFRSWVVLSVEEVNSFLKQGITYEIDFYYVISSDQSVFSLFYLGALENISLWLISQKPSDSHNPTKFFIN